MGFFRFKIAALSLQLTVIFHLPLQYFLHKTLLHTCVDDLSAADHIFGLSSFVKHFKPSLNVIPYPFYPTADLKKMFKKVVDAKTDKDRDAAFDPIMEIIMLIQFANDECDYGEGLELGLDMFSYGGGNAFKSNILNLMTLAYQLLGRHEYREILEAHLQDRRHSANLSQLD